MTNRLNHADADVASIADAGAGADLLRAAESRGPAPSGPRVPLCGLPGHPGPPGPPVRPGSRRRVRPEAGLDPVTGPASDSNTHPPQFPYGGPTAGPPCGHDVDTVWLSADGDYDPARLRGLNDYTEVHGDLGPLEWRGRLGNMAVRASPSGLFVQGSPRVLATGTNAVPYEPADFRAGLERVERAVGAEPGALLAARVVRLDVGVNVPVPRDVAEYASRIEAPPRWRRGPSPGRATAVVGNGSNQLTIYDKRAQAHHKGMAVSPAYGEGPLARVERRFLRNVAGTLGGGLGRPVTAGDLLDPDFFAGLGRRLVADLERCPFRPRHRVRPCRTAGELRAELAIHGIEHLGGPESVYDLVRMWAADRKAAGAGGGDASRQRRLIKDLLAKGRASDPEDVGRELIAAVCAAAG